ncbi:ferredoxin [bacterium]|nr:ferredoxin [bacterium]
MAMSDKELPHPKSANGPFYIIERCCIACDVPVSTAPEVFAYDEELHCCVYQQPRASDELDRTIDAAWC